MSQGKTSEEHNISNNNRKEDEDEEKPCNSPNKPKPVKNPFFFI